ncbi:hypothetical protein Xind_02719 [Xenorhabdus indica]|nr:hypothetical protein [Xenorhabdus indica]
MQNAISAIWIFFKIIGVFLTLRGARGKETPHADTLTIMKIYMGA